jgi:hypothetical protein
VAPVNINNKLIRENIFSGKLAGSGRMSKILEFLQEKSTKLKCHFFAHYGIIF